MSHPPTKSEIRVLFESSDLHPDRRLGQNFLVDGNQLRMLVHAAHLGPLDTVLEVGAAIGNLTELLVERAGRVVAVEVDPAVAFIGQERRAGAENLDYIVGDILAGKHHIAGSILDVVHVRQKRLGGPLKVVANLPYGVATPLVAELVMKDPPPERLVFTVQEEVGERLMAKPGTREYGPVGVLVQALADVEILRRLGPSVFWPQPKVYSAMLRVHPMTTFRKRIADLAVFRRTIEGLFAHRRKRAAKSLALSDELGRSAEQWAARLADVGLDPEARGEMYAVDEIIHLANTLAKDEVQRRGGA